MKHTSIPKTWIFIFVVVLVTIIGAWIQSSHKESSPVVQAFEQKSQTTERITKANEMIKSGGNSVYIEDQPSGQSNVVVGFTVLTEPGFVVIHEDNNGVPGKVIGSSDLINGRVEQLSIPISDPLVSDHVYYAILHKDNSNGIFLETEDGFMDDKDQTVVMMSFLVYK